MIVTIDELTTESDVEQKLVYPLLTLAEPEGLHIPSSCIKTKANIRRYTIGKGKEQKLYYPDYLIVVSGFPLFVVEAKGPDEDVMAGYRDARLYAAELNAAFPSGVNPVHFVASINGRRLMVGPWDSDSPKHQFSITDLDTASESFALLQSEVAYSRLSQIAAGLGNSLTKRPFFKPTRILGGQSVRNEEIGHNSFGATIALEFRHIFNPSTREDRAHIARNAYIPSKRRNRYVEPIDKIIRAAKPPSETDANTIEDTGSPQIIIDRLKQLKPLEHQVLLLIGSVGAGKSTFVDYLTEVALPKEILQDTVWVHINMNAAPISHDLIYDWLAEQILEGCRASCPGLDFDEIETLQRLYAVELNKFRKGPGSLLGLGTAKYNEMLANEIIRIQSDVRLNTKAHVRYCCAERSRLLIVVLDNCDKRIRDEQLLMFQAAEWVQKEFRTLIILPLRDETYDNHRHEPPLDTALKDLVFRIEPPLFQHVLTTRVQLALKEMERDPEDKLRSYCLPNGYRVEYPVTNQAFYLTSILRSVFEHDRYVRRMLVGLSGRNIRRAMELFLEFCHSGHIGEDEIFKMIHFKGDYALPLHLVVRVLLRMNKRFYDGEMAYIKNIFASDPQDPHPNYFIRLLILRWLARHFKEPGPTGIQGYRRVSDLKSELVSYGFSQEMLERELIFLLKAQCVVSENFRVDALDDEDLIRLAPAGFLHLESIYMIDYLAAIAEDTWFKDESIARDVAQKIGNLSTHYIANTAIKNARKLIDYLAQELSLSFPSPEAFIQGSLWRDLVSIKDAVTTVERAEENRSTIDPWFTVDKRYEERKQYLGVIVNRLEYGLLVELEPGLVGLAHKSKIPNNFLMKDDFLPGERIKIEVLRILPEGKRLELAFIGFPGISEEL